MQTSVEGSPRGAYLSGMAFQQGVGELRRALHRELPVEGVWISREARLPGDVYRLLRERKIPLHRVDPRRFQERFGQAAGVVFRLSELSPVSPEAFLKRLRENRGIGLVLDEVQDVGNAGNIARSAAFFGATGIVLPARRSVPLSSELLHTSSGGAARLLWTRVPSLAQFLEAAREQGVWIYALETGGKPLPKIAFVRPLLLVVGAEKRGIRKGLLRLADAVVSIPGRNLSSLNVASATAIALYAITRTEESP